MQISRNFFHISTFEFCFLLLLQKWREKCGSKQTSQVKLENSVENTVVRFFVCSFVRLVVCSFVRSFARSFARSFVRLFVRSLVRLPVRLFVRSFGQSVARLFVLSSMNLVLSSLQR